VTWDPAAEPTGDDETGPRANPEPGEPQDTVPLAPVRPASPLPASLPAPLPVPSADSGDYRPPSYGPPSYGPSGHGQPGYSGSGFGGPGYGQAGMRAAAADRERTLDVLKAAYGEGRLTRDEFETRTGKTMSARYYGELAAIVGDLPAGPMHPAPYQPGYYPVVPMQPTNGLAVGALVCGILEFFTLGVAAVPAVILGHMAHGQIKRTGERGDGMAITGMVLGWMGIAGWLLFILLLSARP
jgi:Domain of unknown function (DUF4190)/Domain of unknown function (DUF1707)